MKMTKNACMRTLFLFAMLVIASVSVHCDEIVPPDARKFDSQTLFDHGIHLYMERDAPKAADYVIYYFSIFIVGNKSMIADIWQMLQDKDMDFLRKTVQKINIRNPAETSPNDRNDKYVLFLSGRSCSIGTKKEPPLRISSLFFEASAASNDAKVLSLVNCRLYEITYPEANIVRIKVNNDLLGDEFVKHCSGNVPRSFKLPEGKFTMFTMDNAFGGTLPPAVIPDIPFVFLRKDTEAGSAFYGFEKGRGITGIYQQFKGGTMLPPLSRHRLQQIFIYTPTLEHVNREFIRLVNDDIFVTLVPHK